MAGKEQDYRIFVGGLSRDIIERQLEDAFSRFGKIIDSQVLHCSIRQAISINVRSSENPGVTVSQFSFQTPAPMEENYVRKRRSSSAASHEMSDALMPVAAIPISWIAPDQLRDLHFGEEGNSTSEVEAEEPAESLGPCVNDPTPGAGS